MVFGVYWQLIFFLDFWDFSFGSLDGQISNPDFDFLKLFHPNIFSFTLAIPEKETAALKPYK